MCKQLNDLGVKQNEIICSELTIRNKKWIIASVYKPPLNSNLKNFFDELENTLNKALSKVDNIIVLGDINIDCHNPNHNDFDYINTLCETFNLKNLIKDKTCFASTHGSSIDVILTNKPRSFQHTLTCETGLSDHHHMITTFLRSHLVRLKSKKIFYRVTKGLTNQCFWKM